MDLTNMTPTERAAWHRSEADRIEAEERARRPALAAGQVWERDGIAGIIGRDSNEQFYLARTDGLVVWLGKSDPGLNPKWAYVGLARDVLRVVPPGDGYHLEIIPGPPPLTPAPQVAPEYAPIPWTEAKEGDEYQIGEKWWKFEVGEGYPEGHPKVPELFRWRRRVAQVAPDPTGAELVGRRCWVRRSNLHGWEGPFDITDARNGMYYYMVDGRECFMFRAKPYVEGVAP